MREVPATKNELSEYRLANEIITRGSDIIFSESIEPLKTYIQHGTTTVFSHSLSVAKYSLRIVNFLENKLGIKVDRNSLVRGALLHDYFLYDWHDKQVPGRRIHGFTHPGKAMRNAVRDFEINTTERDIIRKHMFPLTPVPPMHRESLIVCIADKWSALFETFKLDASEYLVNKIDSERQLFMSMNRRGPSEIKVAADNV